MNSIELAKKIRVISLQLAHDAKASHLGGALSAADLLAVLYTDILLFDPKRILWDERDRFLYSKGHACTALYAVLQETGFFEKRFLDNFSKNGSVLTTHVNHSVPGVELSTGSLGHALPIACGMALAAKKKNMSYRVFVMLSDGELDEGSNWEAFLFAAHHRLDNLTVIVDYNKIQSFGTTDEVIGLEPLAKKFESFRWDVKEVDGHDHNTIRNELKSVPYTPGKPSIVIAHTVKGKGVDFMEGKLMWHYKSPSSEQLEIAINQLENKT